VTLTVPDQLPLGGCSSRAQGIESCSGESSSNPAFLICFSSSARDYGATAWPRSASPFERTLRHSSFCLDVVSKPKNSPSFPTETLWDRRSRRPD
jgi:hypothetical protein